MQGIKGTDVTLPQDRIDTFARYGWKIVFFDETMLDINMIKNKMESD